MTIIKFGKSKVTGQGIDISQAIHQPYHIAASRLWDVTERFGVKLWEWPIHLIEKTWLSKDDLDDFNLAFFFARDFFKDNKAEYPKDVSTAQTLYVQKQMKENHDRVAAISAPEMGLSMPPDEETIEYREDCAAVTKKIELLN